ncbi:hypothetical protein [Streptomyces sp. JB150]|uniref:hypothetical protein n=1 Tax=Streptomyces sp. JB150 TaxID=2714844 RepID=UPI00140CD2F6|nr:hypothetical protein [Streptomyces sp. JB150]QIJ60801.1 hypothetical protein G7Z13_01170 [Streptomyces sp. JB150]
MTLASSYGPAGADGVASSPEALDAHHGIEVGDPAACLLTREAAGFRDWSRL